MTYVEVLFLASIAGLIGGIVARRFNAGRILLIGSALLLGALIVVFGSERAANPF